MKKRLACFLAALTVAGLFMMSPAFAPAYGEVTLEVLNPRGEITAPPTLAPTPRVTDLAGKRIGIYWNNKAGGNNFWDVVAVALKDKYPTARIIRYDGPFDPGDKMAQAMAGEVDLFLYGVGD